MKLSLRNLALGAVVLATGAMAAQDAPTVTQKWIQHIGVKSGDFRSGTGVNGTVYMSGLNTIKAINADGVKDYTFDGLTFNKGMSADDAGNLFVLKGWPTGAGTTAAYIIKPDLTTVTEVAVKVPKESNYPVGRSDVQGNAIGDFFSEDGGALFIASSGSTCPVCVMYQNGEPVDVEYLTEAKMAAANSMASAVPSVATMEELLADDTPENMFYYRSGGNLANIYYFDEEGTDKCATLPVPTNLPKDYVLSSQNGFSVFTLGGVRYQLRPMQRYGVNWGSDFLICDDEGNIVFHTEYSDDYVSTSGATGNGCNLIARVINDKKVEIYQVYTTTQSADVCFAAMYEMTIGGEVVPELPAVYLAGDFQGWNPAEAVEMTATAGVYEYTFAPSTGGAFKMSTAKGTWDEFNASAFGVAEDNQSYTLPIDEIVKVEAGKIGNLAFPGKGTWTLVYDHAKMEVVLKGELDPLPPVTLPDFYLRGDLNNWGTGEAYKMTYTGDATAPVANENGEYPFTITVDKLSGAFKFASEDWNTFNYGAKGEDPVVENGKTLESWTGSSVNFNMGDLVLENATITFFYQPDGSKPSYVKVEGTEPVVAKTTDRGQFVYNLSQVKGENNQFTITFDATGDAASAVLVLTYPTNDVTEYVALDGEVKKGANTFTVDLSNYAKAEEVACDWAIELHNYEIPEDIVTPAQVLPQGVTKTNPRGGVVCMTDPTNEFYGYTVVANPCNGGFDVYNQVGEKIHEGIHKLNDAMGGTASNNSNPMRGRQRGTTAQFACWGDAAYGVVALDLKDIDKAPYSVFEGTKEASGKVMNGEIAVGSGTPGLAYYGEGENTLLFTYDEDIFKNQIVFNPIGNAMTTGKAAEVFGGGFHGVTTNTNVDLCATKGGLFFSQVRANGMESGTPGLAYINFEEKDITWRSSDEAEANPNFLPSACASVDINPAGDLLAVATTTGVSVYLLSWDGEMPVLEPYKTIATPFSANTTTSMRFDAGNNLHFVKQTTGYYQIIMADKEPISTTAATSKMNLSSGVENVAVEAEAADAVYYNLNGVKVAADALVPGVYVKVVGKTATKVVVK